MNLIEKKKSQLVTTLESVGVHMERLLQKCMDDSEDTDTKTSTSLANIGSWINSYFRIQNEIRDLLIDVPTYESEITTEELMEEMIRELIRQGISENKARSAVARGITRARKHAEAQKHIAHMIDGGGSSSR